MGHTFMKKSGKRRSAARLFGSVPVIIAAALSTAGCIWKADAEGELVYGHPTVRVATVPPDIYAYPRYYYRGDVVYLVDGRWYYHTPRGWVIFRDEPRELAERRIYILNQRDGSRPRRVQPRYYEERPAPASPQEPIERGRRYYPDR